MTFTGTFNSYNDTQTYLLQIAKQNEVNPETTDIIDPLDSSLESLDDDDLIVMFDPEPVTLSCDRQDLTKRIIISQASIGLVSNQDLTDYLFAETDRDITVSIRKTTNNTDAHVFFGYVDPLQFNQGYAYKYETIVVNATDPLGALEHIKITDNLIYNNAIITPSTTITNWDLILSILSKLGLDQSPIGQENIDANVKTALQTTKPNMSVFFGADYVPEDAYTDKNNVMTLYEVLEEICKYFNLYIAMCDAGKVIITSTINQTLVEEQITNFKEKAMDDSTSISVDEAYDTIKVTCKIEPTKDIITPLDDKDNLRSDYPYAVKYMTELVSAGEGKDAWSAFDWMKRKVEGIQPLGEEPKYDEFYSRDYYMYALRNDAWDFGETASTPYGYIIALGGTINDPMTIDQRYLLNWLAGGKMRAALVGFGRGNEIKKSIQDNSLQSSLSLDKCLVISTMGNYDNSSAGFQSMGAAIQSANPVCKYTSIDSSILSPPDNYITNYIVISGNIILNPLQPKTGSHWDGSTLQQILYNRTYLNTWQDILDNFVDRSEGPCWHHTVAITDNGDGGYYNQKWDFKDPNGTVDGVEYTNSNNAGVYGFLENPKNKKYPYECNYCADGTTSTNDLISKIPILACQLKVGTKYCVERLDWGEAGINHFEWMTEAECQAAGIQPVFTIGVNPKIGDAVIGMKYQIANTIDYTMNVDATGTAIPITAADELSGQIEFSILGPYNLAWDDATKMTWVKWIWYAAGLYEDKYCIMNNIQSIIVSSLKIDVKSDNGGMTDLTTADNDLVYMQSGGTKYNENLETDFNLVTPLTLSECQDWGIKYQISNSYIYKTNDDPFRGWGTTGNEVKPEECLVDYYAKEYSAPAKIFETTLKNEAFANGLLGNALNKEMLHNYITGIYPDNIKYQIMSYETSLKGLYTHVKLRECKTFSNPQIGN